MERVEFETIVYEKDGGVARIVLNTPDKANIQTAQQVWDMDKALVLADDDDDVKVLVLKANGEGFCAGHAIVGIDEMPEVYPTTGPTPERTWRRHHQGLFLWPPLRLWEFPKATIAQVHGYCVGGGTVYGLLTDLTIVSEDAYFQMPLPQGFGLPGAQTMIEPWVLMNFKRAAEYLFLAPTISATQALDWGMVNRIVPRADLEETVEEIAAHHRQDAAHHHPRHQAGAHPGVGDDGDADAPPAVHRPRGAVHRCERRAQLHGVTRGEAPAPEGRRSRRDRVNAPRSSCHRPARTRSSPPRGSTTTGAG